MSAFRDLVAEMDEIVFDELHDDVTVDGRAVQGMFASPWLGPQVGQLKTGLIEPRLDLREADAQGVKKGSTVGYDGKDYTVVAVEPDGTGITTLVLRPIL